MVYLIAQTKVQGLFTVLKVWKKLLGNKMAKKVLTEKDWNNLTKEVVKSFAYSLFPERGDNIKVAKALNMSLSAIEQMKSLGKGSLKTLLKTAVYKTGLSASEIKSLFSNFSVILKEAKPLSELDCLFEELKRKYKMHEIAALLQLLLAKRDVEEFVGIKIRVTQNKKTKKKSGKKRKKL